MSGALIATLNTGSSGVKLAAYNAAPAGIPCAALLRASLSGIPDAPEPPVQSCNPEFAKQFIAAVDISNMDPGILAPRLLDAIESAVDKK